jgi:tripartite-type tricarboxylate transporter receptor subunit TctC
MKSSMSKSLLFVLLASVLFGAAGVRAQTEFPTKPVSLIVPFPPGGAVDLAARSFGQALAAELKQPVLINTRPGAGGGIGMTAAANAEPDGHTLLATHPALHALPEADRMFGRLSKYDRTKFKPLALLVADPLVLVVKADAPWKTYAEFVADARRNPGKISYSSSGPYSAVHLPVEMLAHAADMKLQHVSYAGGGPALNAVLGGHVTATTPAPAVAAPHIRTGALRALVITGAKRHPLLPDVPTAMELGYKDVEFYLWVGIFAPVDTPEPVAEILRKNIGRAAQRAEFTRQMSTVGTPIDYRDGQAFVEFLNRDARNISEAIKRIGKVE